MIELKRSGRLQAETPEDAHKNAHLDTETLIVGGGLCGLHTSFELGKRGRSHMIVEARRRLGGRILSRRLSSPSGQEVGFDLGPAWFWPGQRRMERLIVELGLEADVVKQFGDGDALFEDAAGQVRRGLFGIAMLGSYRLRGGMAQLIEALAQTLPSSSIRLGWTAESITWQGEMQSEAPLQVTLQSEDGPRIVTCHQLVLALPPRLAQQRLRFEPPATPALAEALRATPTWMAGQGKLVALYERPFWRSRGLSGDAISQRGPLGEVHDISPSMDPEGRNGPGALFGFFALPPSQRQAVEKEALERACIAQLARLFGTEASQPTQVWLKDWAFDPRTATDDDRQHMAPHAEHDLMLPEDDPWQQRILWSGSETASAAQRNNGYLEGALEASERTLRRLLG